MDFYSVFSGFENSHFKDKIIFEGDIFENIEKWLLKDYEKFKSEFEFDDFTNHALFLLAKNSRKRYSIHRKITHFKALQITKELLNSGVLNVEKSKEILPQRTKGQKLKKELRHYTIQDKVLFQSPFLRFFFRFLKPNETLIMQGNFELVLEKIKSDFEHYQSFCFEELGREILERKFKLQSVQSYWNKDLEFDLYYKDLNFLLVGEVKFKNKKICKNVLNQLKLKAKKLGLDPNLYVLFSKSGFSKEFDKNHEENVLLLDLNALTILLEKEENE